MSSSYLECDCDSFQHIAKVELFSSSETGDTPELFISINLHQYRSLFQRVVVAAKYIFGYKSRFGDYDVISLKPESAKSLNDLTSQFLMEHQKLKENK